MIVLVAKTVVDGQIGPDLPLILCIKDQVILFEKPIAGAAVVPWIGRARIAQDLDVGRLIGQQRSNVREGIGGSSLAVRVQAHRTELAPELQRMLLFDHAQIVYKGVSVVGIWLP